MQSIEILIVIAGLLDSKKKKRRERQGTCVAPLRLG
jgi:hypothetical protein